MNGSELATVLNEVPATKLEQTEISIYLEGVGFLKLLSNYKIEIRSDGVQLELTAVQSER